MAVALPFIAMAAAGGGAAIQGADQRDALNANAAVMGYEGKVAGAQGAQAEANQRRRTGMILGSETAAAGQAGAGYGGSVGRAVKQSAMNAELDALNIRYKSQLQKWSYDSQSSNLRAEGDTAGRAGLMKAGAALLQGYSGNYVGGDGVNGGSLGP